MLDARMNDPSLSGTAKPSTAACTANMASAVTDTRPLFKSVDHALRFAYTIHLYPAYPESELARLFKIRVRAEPGMTPMDWHAQAAMIRTHCNTRLEKVELAYVECWYGNKLEYYDGLHRVVDYALPRVVRTGIVQRSLVRELVRRHFQAGSPRQRTYKGIAFKLDIELKIVEKYGGRVRDALSGLSLRVDDALSRDFERLGLV